jgi:hypothetical protein
MVFTYAPRQSGAATAGADGAAPSIPACDAFSRICFAACIGFATLTSHEERMQRAFAGSAHFADPQLWSVTARELGH